MKISVLLSMKTSGVLTAYTMEGHNILNDPSTEL